MTKLNRDFFSSNEVLFVGYSSRNKIFSQDIYRGFVNNGIKVYPYNTRKDGAYDIKVFNRLDELEKIPSTAFILLNKDNAKKAAQELAEKGVRRILFQNKKSVDEETLSMLNQKGIETCVGCPMMLFGKGLHKLHAFFAGVR